MCYSHKRSTTWGEKPESGMKACHGTGKQCLHSITNLHTCLGTFKFPSDSENTLQSLSKAMQDGVKPAPWEFWSCCACTKPTSSLNNFSSFLFPLQNLGFRMCTGTGETFLWGCRLKNDLNANFDTKEHVSFLVYWLSSLYWKMFSRTSSKAKWERKIDRKIRVLGEQISLHFCFAAQ